MTPTTTDQETHQISDAPATGWTVTTRSIVIGLALVPVNVYWVIVSEYRFYNILTLNPLFVTPIFYLFVLAGVNLLLRRAAPRWAFNPAELVVIYVMLVMSCTIATHDYMINLVTTMSWSRWLATPENGWETSVLPLLPKWLVVTDRNALAGFFTGNVSMYDPRILRAWAVPMAFWSAFVMVCAWVMLCMTVVFRKAWVEDTRLSFPIVRLPLTLINPDETDNTLRTSALWIGFGAAAGISILNGLQMWYPSLPHIQTRAFYPTFAQTAPWSVLNGTPVAFYPFAIGLAYLVPLDISFSCWFFHLFIKMQSVVGYMMGYGGVPDFPYPHEQGIGAWFAFGIALLFMSRRYLRGVWQTAMNPESKRDAGEPFSYRAALVGLMAGVLALLWFWRAVGMGLTWAAFTIATYLLVSICITRVRAEAGGQHAVWDPEPMNLARLFGSDALGTGNIAGSALSHWYWRLNRSHMMPSMLESLKLGGDCGVRLRSLVGPMMLALAVSTVFGFWSCMHVGYTEGVLAKCIGNGNWTAGESFYWLDNAVRNGLHPDPARWGAVGASGALVVLLSWLRARYAWFPLHPLGYCIGNELRWHWMPFFVAWLVKLVVLRHGALKLYRRTLPFFLGLVLGDYTLAAIWSLIGVIWKVPTYQMFH